MWERKLPRGDSKRFGKPFREPEIQHLATQLLGSEINEIISVPLITHRLHAKLALACKSCIIIGLVVCSNTMSAFPMGTK